MRVTSPSRTKSDVKAVTFDVWETLLLERNGWSLRRRNARCNGLVRVLRHLGSEISTDQLALAFKRLDSWLATVWNENREVTHLDQIRFLVETVSKDATRVREEWIDQLSSAYVSAIFEVPPYLNPEAHEVLQWLKDSNKPMGLVCNVGLTPGFGLRELLARMEVAKYFDAMVFSDEVDLRKPDPRIFQKVAEELQLKPCKIVHIGDNLKNDVWGAKKAGFKAIHLSTEVGRDRIAESDPTSLISFSRRLDDLNRKEITPDKTIESLAMAIEVIKQLQT